MSNGPPICQECGATKTWREGGVNKAGAAYAAFWGCPNYKNHPPKGQPVVASIGIGTAPQPPQAGRSDPPPAQTSTDLSIAAQACSKAAAHAFSGIAGTWSAQQIEDGVYSLAVRLFCHLVAPAGRGQAPTPAGFTSPRAAALAAVPTHPNAPREPGEDSDLDFGEPR